MTDRHGEIGDVATEVLGRELPGVFIIDFWRASGQLCPPTTSAAPGLFVVTNFIDVRPCRR
jgi:hypothetical protein